MPAVLDKKKTDSKPFNFDLDRMKQSLISPSHTMPSNLTFKEFQEWMKSKAARD